MKKEQIIQAMEPVISGRGCFLVEVKLSADNDIEIVIEKGEGIVDWEDCAAIDRAMHEVFDQDVEDYALTVSSAGLDRPAVPESHRKPCGCLAEGRKESERGAESLQRGKHCGR